MKSGDEGSASSVRLRISNEARGYASDTIAKAQGEVDKLRKAAESFCQQYPVCDASNLPSQLGVRLV